MIRGVARRNLVYNQRPQNTGMNRELVPVDLGKYRIQVHECPAVWNIKGQHRINLRLRSGENILRQLLDRLSARPLGDTDRNYMLVQVQNVSTLNMEGIIPVVVQFHFPGKIRVITENILAVDCLLYTSRCV